MAILCPDTDLNIILNSDKSGLIDSISLSISIMTTPCNVGFAVSMVLVASVLLSLTILSCIVNISKDEGVSAIAYLTLGVPSLGMALLYGIGTQPSDKDRMALFIIFGVFVFGPWILLGLFTITSNEPKFRNNRHKTPCLVATNCLVLPGLILLAIYFKQCIEPLDYRGPMYIINTQVQSQRYAAIGGDSPQPAYTKRKSQVQVAFGSHWACPNLVDGNEVWCETWARVKDCEFCSIKNPRNSRCALGTYDDAQSCLKENAFPDLIQWEDAIGWPNPYDDSLSFRKDERPDDETTQWPVGVFYGDCKTCSAYQVDEYDEHLTYARRLRLAAIIMIGIGVFVVVADFLVIHIGSLRDTMQWGETTDTENKRRISAEEAPVEESTATVNFDIEVDA